MISPRLRALVAFGVVSACGGGGGGSVDQPSISSYERPPSSFDLPPSTYESPGSGDQDPSGNGGTAGSCAPCNEELTCSEQVGSNNYRFFIELRTFAGACVVTESGGGVDLGAVLACDGTFHSTGTVSGTWSRASNGGLSFCSSNDQGICAACSFVTQIDGGGPDAFPTPPPPEPGGGGQPGFSASDGGAVD
jgi:hypothetical protein